MRTKNLLQLLSEYKVVIPPIQRDYAQGRNSGKIPRIRERFLEEIKKVLTDETLPPLELDFIYGYIQNEYTDSNDVRSYFKPLDGQQRLTTLFLLHWFVAVKENYLDDAKYLLSKFTYATRRSSRLFCEKLIEFKPAGNRRPIDTIIENQPWFFSNWRNDPTISSMLVMLHDIEKKFAGCNNIWEKLNSDKPRIIFHLLPMEDLGLPDDLYIKMNSRGKELTDFEHFKSQFSVMLDDQNADCFNKNIDVKWSELFWNLFKEKESTDIAKDVDKGFLNYFWYITDILIAKNKIQIKDNYWLATVETVYKNKPEKIGYLFKCLDIFEQLEREEPGYFNALFYIKEEDFGIEKTRIFFISPEVNLFSKCAEKYNTDAFANPFSIGEQLLLYAFIFPKFQMTRDYKKKIRKLRNIFAISETQLRKDYLPVFLYDDVESMLSNNTITDASKLSKAQLKEEAIKEELLRQKPELTESIYKLEDHHLLRGSISIFDIDETIPDYAKVFQELFMPGCDFYQISQAMLTFGDYSQSYGRLSRLGNKNNSTWRELLTPSEYRKGFEKTKKVIKQYLEVFINNPEASNESIIQSYLRKFDQEPQKPKDWIYYYIRYQNFKFWEQNSTNGFYMWDDFDRKPYECTMLFRTQFNGRHWDPFLLEVCNTNHHCSIENYGNDLQYTKGELIFLIKNLNNGFRFSATDEYSSAILDKLIVRKALDHDAVLIINQNEGGFDLEDRIQKCSRFLDIINEDQIDYLLT